MNRLERIINLKLNNFEIVVPKEEMKNYPWDECIADQMEKYGDEETAKKICGAIKALYASKEEFVIPDPSGSETEDEFIGRCISAISDEYSHEQSIAICIGKWKGE